MRALSEIKLKPNERKAINAFSRRLKKALGKQLVSVLLFGSKARGDSNWDSDVDIFVLIRKQTVASLSKVAKVASDIWWDYDVLLSTVTYDLEEEEKNTALGSFFFQAVKNEGIRI
jgi:predicted nucleotidyltransferase